MKIYEALGFDAPEHKGPMLGIECETEGSRLEHLNNNVWRTEMDGSLRDGLEYVSFPLKPEQVKGAIVSLHKHIKDQGGKVRYSFRCSTHVHINVLDMSENEVMTMMFLYMMYENVFMNFVAPERVGNRFCLRFQDAQALTNELCRFFMTAPGGLRGAIIGLHQENLKYAALNLYTLRKYGTLEFRALEGCSDEKRIHNWVTAIVKLREQAVKIGNPLAAYEKFIEDPQYFVDGIFMHDPASFLKEGWKNQVEEGFSQNQAVLMYIGG